VVDQAGGGGAERHSAHRLRIELGLSEGEPAMFFDRAYAEGAVAAAAREDDADSALPLVLGQGGKERVDGAAVLPRRRRRRHAQGATLDRQGGIRRNDEDPVCRHPHSAFGFHDRHGGMLAEQLDEHALVVRIEMLHQHERHAAVRRHVSEERLEGLEAAGGGADADDQRERVRFRAATGISRRLRPARLATGVALLFGLFPRRQGMLARL
jgi:hypothetical protein